MNCSSPQCGAPNPEANKFCGACGKALNETLASFKDIFDSNMRSYMQECLRTEVKAQLAQEELLTYRVTENVLSKLQKWIGIPLGLMLTILGLLGYKTFADINNQLLDAQQLATKIGALKTDYGTLKSQLDEAVALSREVKALNQKVDKIQQVVFGTSPALTPKVKSQLNTELLNYQSYLVSAGFSTPKGKLTIDIDPKIEPGLPAYFMPDTNTIKINPQYLQDQDYILLNYTHGPLTSLQKKMLSSNNNDLYAIESALSMYYVCSYKDSPKFGASGFPYNLNDRNDFPSDTTSLDYHQLGLIWSEIFWEIRQVLGPSKTDKLLLSAWKTLQASPQPESFSRNAYFERLKECAGSDSPAISAIFTRRCSK